VKKIVEEHNGGISARNTGAGAAITARFPFAGAADALRAPDESVSA
jgi:nitrogen fixation/metabolism regulation signal transduction histidine kinase